MIKDQLELIKRKDWNTLIILDACRYDMFAVENDLFGSITKTTSIGWNTPSFYRDLPALNDVVLYTANPTPFMLDCKKKFADMKLSKNINPDDNLREALSLNADKIMIHLIPPHMPPQNEDDLKIWNEFIESHGYKENKNAKDWKLRTFGPIGIEEVFYKFIAEQDKDKPREFYVRNLRVALNAIKKVQDMLSYPVVITADHGELLGENGRFGHPIDVDKYDQNLRTVPWFKLSEITDDEAAIIKERLRLLGYM